VHPNLIFRYVEPTVSQTVKDLADWTENKRPVLERLRGGEAIAARQTGDAPGE